MTGTSIVNGGVCNLHREKQMGMPRKLLLCGETGVLKVGKLINLVATWPAIYWCGKCGWRASQHAAVSAPNDHQRPPFFRFCRSEVGKDCRPGLYRHGRLVWVDGLPVSGVAWPKNVPCSTAGDHPLVEAGPRNLSLCAAKRILHTR